MVIKIPWQSSHDILNWYQQHNQYPIPRIPNSVSIGPSSEKVIWNVFSSINTKWPNQPPLLWTRLIYMCLSYLPNAQGFQRAHTKEIRHTKVFSRGALPSLPREVSSNSALEKDVSKQREKSKSPTHHRRGRLSSCDDVGRSDWWWRNRRLLHTGPAFHFPQSVGTTRA